MKVPLLRTALIAALFASTFAAAPATQPAATPTSVSAEPAPKWNAIFQTNEGWIGGDGAYSVQLGPDRVAWFFGDSIIGKVREGHRVDATMVNNTVAIQTGLEPGAIVHFTWGRTADGKAAAMFIPADKTGWFWPQGVARINGRLYLFLAQIDRAKANSGAFAFKGIGQWLAAIDNPDDEPELWRVRQYQLPFAGGGHGIDRSWGSSVMQIGDVVYIYGFDETRKGLGNRQLIVARAPVDRLTDFKSWTFATADGWSRTSTDAAPLAGGMAPEYSVDPLPGGKGYVLVYTENGFSDRILARFADAPRGPWSDAVLLYTSPEMKADKRVFTYAGKNQAWAAKPGELLVTYCQNMFELDPVFENEAVYRPRFVRVKLMAGIPR